MQLPAEIPLWFVATGVAGAAFGLVYFLFTGLRTDHRTGEYHFTWGVGVVVLFLMGIGPGLVGVGLYLTVERGYPSYWLVAAVLAAVVALSLFALSLDVSTTAAATGTVSLP